MKLAIVLGSTRPGRQTPKQAAWVAKAAATISDVDAEIIDLSDYPMPFFNEAVSPRYNQNREIAPDVKKWTDKIASFDAYVFVTPEYNHSIPGVLKNAIDFLTYELSKKPAAVVSHGSAGGARAATDLKEILSESQAVIIPNAVALAAPIMMGGVYDDEGNLADELKANPYGPQGQLEVLLAELKWFSDALSAARD